MPGASTHPNPAVREVAGRAGVERLDPAVRDRADDHEQSDEPVRDPHDGERRAVDGCGGAARKPGRGCSTSTGDSSPCCPDPDLHDEVRLPSVAQERLPRSEEDIEMRIPRSLQRTTAVVVAAGALGFAVLPAGAASSNAL